VLIPPASSAGCGLDNWLLFPGITPGRFGSRAGNGTKTIGRWIRERVGITDPRKAPNHSWRHYFKSVCRNADIEEEYHDALTGHKGESEGRDYGEYYVRVPYLQDQELDLSGARREYPEGVQASAN
jgi:integrase